MNLTLDETQLDVAGLAAQIFAGRGKPDRIDEIEASDEAFDRELWRELAEAGLLGVAVPERHDGLGFGNIELGLICEQMGRLAVGIPLVPTTTAAMLIAAHGSDDQRNRWLPGIVAGSTVIAVAPPAAVVGATRTDGAISGQLVGVAWAHVADVLLVPVGDVVVAISPDAAGITAEPGRTTAREVALTITLDNVAAEQIGGPGTAGWLRDRWLTALANTQAGVADGALRMTAAYTSEREQFGKPLSTFQAVALKAADAYLDSVAIQSAARQAAWTLDRDDDTDAVLAVLTAAWWAAEGGQHCVHVTQHLHGGMGADVTYPVHRYFLWGKQIELLLGGASALLAELGDALATRPDAGDSLVLT
jgi:3-oxocholest-4-en-26-oyl-CoA dehydrogenase beta subunit